jgi:AbrB family looped-hinge helix DNA binding protein
MSLTSPRTTLKRGHYAPLADRSSTAPHSTLPQRSRAVFLRRDLRHRGRLLRSNPIGQGGFWTVIAAGSMLCLTFRLTKSSQMDTVRVSSKGQIVIPKRMREAFAIVPGTQFVISAEGDEIRLRPAPAFPVTSVARGLGLLAKAGRKEISDDEVNRRIGSLLKSRDRRTQRK